MAFWGVKIKAGDSFTHTFDASKGRLHVSMASLDFNAHAFETSILQCHVGYKSPIALCSLIPSSAESVPLNLEFEEADDVVFSVIGRRTVHLSGYFLSGSRNRHLNDDLERRDDNSSQPKQIIDLVSEDEDKCTNEEKECKPGKRKGRRRRLVKAHQGSKCNAPKWGKSDDDEGCYLPKQINELASEDEDKCTISAYHSALKSRRENEDKRIDLTPKRQSEVAPASAVDRENVEIPKKRTERERTGRVKIENEVNVDSDINAENGNILKDVGLVDASGERPNKRKKRNWKKEMNEENTSDIQISQLEKDVTENQGMQEDLNEKRESEEKKVGKKKKSSKKVVDNGEAVIKENPTSSFTDSTSNLTSRVQTLENGLVIEVLESDKPDAKVAVSGNKVSLRYVAKLKKTGEVFDSNVGQDPHKFRIGSGKTIQGLEVGLEGMRVCEKRRITVPPTMAYGSEGNGDGNVPPDSWLVFEVELVKVH